MAKGSHLQVIYDGDCPFCSSYVKFARLKKRFDQVDLINARERPDLVKAYADKGMDINEGMVVMVDGHEYYGGEAVWAINTLASSNPLFNLLGGRKFLVWLYPALRGGRNLTLRLMGRHKIPAPKPSSALAD